jgi:hypothetical protein
MTALSIALVLSLGALGDAPRGARPAQRDSDATSTTSTEATAQLSDEQIERRVRTYLAAIDTPITAAQWRELGSRAIPPLEQVLQDPDALPSRRAKAVTALSLLGGPRARELVLQAARSEQESFGVRSNALRGAARLLPEEELAAELRPVLERAQDPAIRATAADVLARHAGRSSCNAVRAQADKERARERTHFSRALERCGGGGG